jgi:putative MATE family efflux protein
MRATFTEGSIFKHICSMTFAGTAGLLSLFFVDLVDMYWLSLLGGVEPAAVGYAGSILFFTLSMNIGLSIGCAALVSQTVASRDWVKTGQLVGNIFAAIFILSIVLVVVLMFNLGQLLRWLGAEGESHALAAAYLKIVLPTMPLMGLAMASNGLMRALGKAKQGMYLTLIGGVINAFLDPLLIFVLDMGMEGAALATVLSRFGMIAFAYRKVVHEYKILALPQKKSFINDVVEYFQTAIPAVLTNLSTPIGVAYVTSVMAQFGDSAVAGNAIVGKLQPLAFAGLFALSGSIGPIAGQNFGAKMYDRIMATLRNSIYFVLVYCAVSCTILLLLTDVLINAFQAEGDAAKLILWFCYGFSLVFVFNGITFVTNAMFNNLRAAHWATVFNFAKATVFTMPFAFFGAKFGGPIGIYAGLLLGSAIIALLGMAMAYYKIKNLPQSSRASTALAES